MRCSQGHENPEGSAFCDECGERLDTSSAAQPAVAVASAPSAAADAGTGAGTAAASGAKLVVVSDNFVFEVPDKPEVLIGREDPLSDIYPDLDLTEHGGEEGGVSRMHAKLLNTGGQWSLEDENSTNSTFLNRQKLTAKTPAPVKDGDEIRLGKVALRFQNA
ncbi:MAG TPA: FHA domain-containing protein [Ktedonobacterales bacterium]